MKSTEAIGRRILSLLNEQAAHEALLERHDRVALRREPPDDPEERLAICENISWTKGKISGLRWVLRETH